ncbi:RES family NAD+ phosphorylase [Flavobacterium sp. GT3R68]|uniref:RES family NAD+ phosphorylase n=1 Tax=Flavobacterium sp. GT3R68 TaxID=2594437 RepID=UPI000F886475|nr:RES family NAD+ phosphorylase [Flavobacterium sp. GT3R68]RTY89316.1 hypothetical protein EKL32_22940 [Flavobacterium sp. GSN2]TRW93876.1 hypothetical protein FNW07_02915 [Flavobacterium sp. GT3R68]
MNVCSNCFNDDDLKLFIETNLSIYGHCNFCNNPPKSELIAIEELLDFFSDFLSSFEEDENGIPLLDLIHQDWNFFTNKDKGLGILSEVLTKLDSTINTPLKKVRYEEEIFNCISFWSKLKEDLKWESRFLTDLKSFEDFRWDTFFQRNSSLHEDSVLFRARIHPNDAQSAFNTLEMGCPDKTKSLGGRANPQGIPYLYLSMSESTTFYETRATYLDEVSVGKFKVRKGEEISLVDFTETTSLFLNSDSIKEYIKSVILKKNISIDLSKPLRRYDSELEYIPTQFICEYIRNISNADGIMFNSSLHLGGVNVVLFTEKKTECIEVNTYRVTNVDVSHKLIS